MTLLLDTHVLLWWLEGSARLSSEAQHMIEKASVQVYVSAISVWEIEIKRAIGKLEAPDDVLDQLEANAFEVLPVTGEHAVAAGRLPRRHDDPFDRMLIAQALQQSLTIVTRDRRFSSYGVPVLAT